MANDDITKAAAQYILKRGLASYAEIAELSQRSRQILRVWVPEQPEARKDYLRKQWEKALKWASKRA